MYHVSPDTLLGYTLNFGGLARRRLERVLGGGATAVVFLGVSPDAPEDTSRHVAVKVARPEPQWREALVTEWRNLTRLEQAERDTRTHYFPRVLWPENEQGLEVELYMRPPGLDWGFYKWVILVQELVQGKGVHDLLLDYPGLRLSEPLALAIGVQYVEMLTILHRANLTCADRKLADLRWTQAYALQPGDPTDLERFRTTKEPPGQLMVLDWNVSAQADPEYIARDLFHFGTLWHRMLLGTEPRFRGGKWRLEEPLDRHPLWRTLSAGTQRILSRLFHPQPDRRYRDAAELLGDMREQVGLWQKLPNDLWQIARSDGEPLEKQWAAVDLLKKLAESWGVDSADFSDFERTYKAIERALKARPFQPLQDAFNRRDWRTAQAEVERLFEAYKGEPERLLLIERYRQIVNTAGQTDAAFPHLLTLWNTYVPELDRLDEKGRKDLKQWKDTVGNPAWRDTLTYLWAEAEYYPALTAARDLRERGDIQGAKERFQYVLDCREILRAPQVIGWLDELLGNPEGEAKKVADQAEELRKASDLLRAALLAVATGTDLEAGKQRLDSALRAAPGEVLLGQAYRLLLSEEAWRRVENAPSVAAHILHLTQWRDALDALLTTTPAGNTGLAVADWEAIKRDAEVKLRHLLQDRQTAIRTQLLSLARGPVPASAAEGRASPAGDGTDTHASLGLLMDLYCKAFGNDSALQDGLENILRDCEAAIRQKLSLVSGPLQDLRRVEERDRVWEEVLSWVYHGKRLAEIAGQPWPEDLSPDVVEKRKAEARGCLAAMRIWLGRYLQAA